METIKITSILQAIVVPCLLLAPTSVFSDQSESDIDTDAALSQPYVSEGNVLMLVAQAGMSALSFDFQNYQKQLDSAKAYFTPEGWKSVMAEIGPNIKVVKANDIKANAVPDGAPVVLSQGRIGGVYQWLVRMPVQVTYKSASAERNDRVNVSVVVKRVPLNVASSGILVNKFNVKKAAQRPAQATSNYAPAEVSQEQVEAYQSWMPVDARAARERLKAQLDEDYAGRSAYPGQQGMSADDAVNMYRERMEAMREHLGQ